MSDVPDDRARLDVVYAVPLAGGDDLELPGALDIPLTLNLDGATMDTSGTLTMNARTYVVSARISNDALVSCIKQGQRPRIRVTVREPAVGAAPAQPQHIHFSPTINVEPAAVNVEPPIVNLPQRPSGYELVTDHHGRLQGVKAVDDGPSR